MPYRNLDEVKGRNAARGDYWFSPDTLAFFESRIPNEIIVAGEGAYFVSRETNPSKVTMWTVRYADESGRVNTVGEFFAHSTKAEAVKAAQEAATAGVTE